MSANRYAMLTLLAREPLSGYDIKQQMNNRMGPFWKIGSNQVYPELAKMDKEGLVKIQGVEQHDYRPARKVYEITEVGKEKLIEWTMAPSEPQQMKDEFLLKAYNSWLIEPEDMKKRLVERKKMHEEKLSVYLDKAAELKGMQDPANPKDPITSSIAVVEFGIQYERLYIEWCEKFIHSC
ncbi:PadR family transcriptional regulator [Niallia sp. 03133]|uniref:PadR family transcriptional regulator n=1 Tax=Niallia sp. 03133 TaxID=3458060 RepID=UPI004043F340